MGCEASQHETRSVDSQSGRRRRRTTTHTAPLGLLLRKYNPTIPIMIGRVERSSTPHLHGKWAESPEYTKRYGEYTIHRGHLVLPAMSLVAPSPIILPRHRHRNCPFGKEKMSALGCGCTIHRWR